MTLLDDIIPGTTGDSVPTSNLLRKITVVSLRMRAVEDQRWVESELNGNDSTNPEQLPAYRGPL